YLLAKEFVTFFEKNKVFPPKQILRMAEAEFISELLLAIHEGIRAGSKAVIDNCYRDYDDEFPNRRVHEKRFRATMDVIGGIVEQDLPELEFRATRLFYPLFCAVFHLTFGLPRLNAPRASLKVTEYPKLKMAMEAIDELINKVKAASRTNQNIHLAQEDRKFYDAYNEHWVHSENRTILTQYICKKFAKAVRD